MMEIQNNDCQSLTVKPYVVSADIQLLLQDWADKKGFSLPSSQFFTGLRNSFSLRMKEVFPGYEMVCEEEITQGLNQMVVKNGLFPVSLDRVYYQSNPRLDLARVVDDDGNSRGLGRRASTPTLLKQFKTLKEAGITEAALVDDVIFSGDLVERVANSLERLGIRVPKVYTGIGIAEGVNKLTRAGRKVEWVKLYNEVIDEVCERDFYPGVPYSGRLLNTEGNVGVPYILPFGKPIQWASIPKGNEIPFSQFCIDQTVRLFQEIEKVTGRVVRCMDLDRKVINLPNDETRYIDALLNVR